MIIVEESPLYQQIFKEGEKRGLEQGLKQGKISLILRQLTKCFGELELNTKTQILNLSVDQVELLAESLLDFSSLEDLSIWLNNANS